MDFFKFFKDLLKEYFIKDITVFCQGCSHHLLWNFLISIFSGTSRKLHLQWKFFLSIFSGTSRKLNAYFPIKDFLCQKRGFCLRKRCQGSSNPKTIIVWTFFSQGPPDHQTRIFLENYFKDLWTITLRLISQM